MKTIPFPKHQMYIGVAVVVDVGQWSKPFVMAFALLISSSFVCSIALAQENFSSGALPDAPEPAQVTSSEANDSQQTSTGSISGTVLDTNGDVLQGAGVALVNPSGAVIRTAQSGSDGQFAFTGLPLDVYKLTVSAPGMSTFTSAQIALQGGSSVLCPRSSFQFPL